MEGFILAAGLGTRLRPLTDDRPKALVEVGGVTLLERAIRRLEAAGIQHIVINVHHFADKVVKFIESDLSDGSDLSDRVGPARIDLSDERGLLLDTGGGLKKAAPRFSGQENILIHNVDILSDIDLQEVERQHVEQGNLVTLCVSRRDTKRLLEFDDGGLLLGRKSEVGGRNIELAFSGISVVSPELFPLLPEADHPYPVIDEYIRLSHEGYRIGCYEHPGTPNHWLDVGKPETLNLANTLY